MIVGAGVWKMSRSLDKDLSSAVIEEKKARLKRWFQVLLGRIISDGGRARGSA
jgi:hypothetical protein